MHRRIFLNIFKRKAPRHSFLRFFYLVIGGSIYIFRIYPTGIIKSVDKAYVNIIQFKGYRQIEFKSVINKTAFRNPIGKKEKEVVALR